MSKIYRTFLYQTNDFCSPCNFGIYSTLCRVGLEKKIPLIILGFSQKLEATPLFRSRRFCGDSLIEAVLKDKMKFSEYKDFFN